MIIPLCFTEETYRPIHIHHENLSRDEYGNYSEQLVLDKINELKNMNGINANSEIRILKNFIKAMRT